MNKKIPLEDVFENYCEYTHCIYNYDESCDYDDHISEYMTYKKGNSFVTCNAFKTKEGYCDCGYELIEYIERHPYGNTYAEEYLLMCPNCD